MALHMSIVLPANAALKFVEKEQKFFMYISQLYCNQNWQKIHWMEEHMTCVPSGMGYKLHFKMLLIIIWSF